MNKIVLIAVMASIFASCSSGTKVVKFPKKRDDIYANNHLHS